MMRLMRKKIKPVPVDKVDKDADKHKHDEILRRLGEKTHSEIVDIYDKLFKVAEQKEERL